MKPKGMVQIVNRIVKKIKKGDVDTYPEVLKLFKLLNSAGDQFGAYQSAICYILDKYDELNLAFEKFRLKT